MQVNTVLPIARCIFASAFFVSVMACGTSSKPPPGPLVYNFEECVSAGNAVLKSDPPQCKTSDGRIFTGIKGYSDQILAQRAAESVSSYEECVARGYAVLKSLPPQCVAPDGRRFIQGQADQTPAPQKSRTLCKDLCGNGSCEEMVCLGEGCPCSETPTSCPKDCR